jgi:hypothetical protein
MEKPEIVTKSIKDFNVWDSSIDPNFIDICAKSRIPDRWVSYRRISLDPKYFGSVLKPINKYAESLYPKPELICISDTEIRLRQFSHAEVFILVNSEKEKFLDRPWMRQFYKSAYSADSDQECFDNVFVAYTPWVFDLDITVSFQMPDAVDTAYKIFECRKDFLQIPEQTTYLEPKMIPFRFKKVGSHMQDEEFGKVKKGSAIYDMVIPRSDIIEQRVKDFYANN